MGIENAEIKLKKNVHSIFPTVFPYGKFLHTRTLMLLITLSTYTSYTFEQSSTFLFFLYIFIKWVPSSK